MRLIATIVCLLGLAGAVRAQETDSLSRSPAPVGAAAHQGALLPYSVSGRVNTGRAVGFGYGGYDTARAKPIMGAAAEAALSRSLALRAGAEYGQSSSQARPTVGLRMMILRQEAVGADLSVGVAYRAEGFTEPEGEIEAVIAAGRRFGDIYGLGNLAYGQDPEGHERDLELRLCFLYNGGRWLAGLDSRGRWGFGTGRGEEPKLDLIAGPTAMLLLGPMVLSVQAGPSILKTTTLHRGIAALGGAGIVF
jgi:hypothetical protein